ncbi:MAG: hypothetical protein IJP68_05655, partial [Selenomonadaceae bacterium]|nr:hypothetical protein [Selenomonadaceae bacterium]
LKMNLHDVDSVVISTFQTEFKLSSAKIKIETGKGERFGLDGGSPERSGRLAEKWREEILAALDGAELVLGIADLEDDDGEGIPPVIADIAKEIGALTIFVTIMPVKNWMVPFRRKYAQEFLNKLEARADFVVQIDELHFANSLPPKTLMSEFFDIVKHSAAQDVKNILDCYVSRSFALST